MSELFRPFVEPTVSSPEPAGEKITTPSNFEASKNETPVEREIKDNLEFWETDGKKKYINEYFDTHKIGGEFLVKIHTGQIDKFIKGELEERKYEKTTKNYQQLLQEIEEEIGSNKMELFERMKKITSYLKALNRMREAKKKLGAYKRNDGLD